MNERMQTLHKILHDEEGKKLDENGDHIAHLVNGKWHIAYGHCLDQEQSDEELSVMGLDDELHDWEGFVVNEEQAQVLFEIDIADAYSGALISFTSDELESLDTQRWAVIMSMCYQMGSVSKFKSFIKAVKESDWDRAADEMLWSNGLKKQRRSAWYKETPKRCQKASDIMRGQKLLKEVDAPTVPVEVIAAQLSDSIIEGMKVHLPKMIEDALKQAK